MQPYRPKEIEMTQEEKNHQTIGRALLLFNKLYEPFVISVFEHHASVQPSPLTPPNNTTEPLWVICLEELVKSKNIYVDRSRNSKFLEKDSNNQYHLDTSFLLVLLTQLWTDIFSKYLLELLSKSNVPVAYSSKASKYDSILQEWKNWIFEIRNARNKWAHQKVFSLREAYRYIDTIHYAIEHLYMVSNKNNTTFDQAMKEIIQLKEYALYKMANEWKMQHPTTTTTKQPNRSESMDYRMVE